MPTSSPYIPDKDEEAFKALDLKDDAIKGIRKLRPTWKISKVFPDDTSLSNGLLCVAYIASRKYYLMELTRMA